MSWLQRLFRRPRVVYKPQVDEAWAIYLRTLPEPMQRNIKDGAYSSHSMTKDAFYAGYYAAMDALQIKD